jgi:hypothetical protein
MKLIVWTSLQLAGGQTQDVVKGFLDGLCCVKKIRLIFRNLLNIKNLPGIGGGVGKWFPTGWKPPSSSATY